MVGCVWPLFSSVLTVHMVNVAHIKCNHRDITPFFWDLDKTACGNKPGLCPAVMEVQLPCGSVFSLMARAGCHVGCWLQILLCSPQKPKSVCFCRGFSAGSFPVLSKCCSTIPNFLLHGFVALVFSWSSCRVSLSTKSFALMLSAFMCTHAALLIYTCLWCSLLLKNMIYIIHVWLSYLGKL